MKRAVGTFRAGGLVLLAGLLTLGLSSCASSRNQEVEASSTPRITVGVVPVIRTTLSRRISLSSELVPFQETDVYAKEAGYVKKLYVDYGTRVRAGEVMAILEIPELQAQLQEDQAEIRNAEDGVTRATHELKRYQAQYRILHLDFSRLNSVFKSQPGLVAQQEVDDAQGKDAAASSQVDASQAALQAARSSLTVAKAKRLHDQMLYDYSRITAPFAGVVTARYANLGTLVQAGTSSSTQAIPIVKVSEDSLFRLVIPVPESYVRYIRIGEPVQVRVPSLGRTFPGKVARFSVDVKASTRTMHTEVDVPNVNHLLIPGVYAETDVVLEQKDDVPSIPLQAITHEGSHDTVFVVTADNVAQKRTVSLGLETANDAEVLSGLAPGDRVIVSDRSALKPGSMVRPQIVARMQYNGD